MNFFSSFPFGLKGTPNPNAKPDPITNNELESSNANSTKKSNNRRRNKAKKLQMLYGSEQDEHPKETEFEVSPPKNSNIQEEASPQQNTENTSQKVSSKNSDQNFSNTPEEEENENATDTPPKTSQKNKKKKKAKKLTSNENPAPGHNNVDDFSTQKQSYDTIAFNDDKKLRLSNMDPNVGEIKALIEAVLSLFHDMKELCNSSSEQIVERQRSWPSMMQKFNDLMKKSTNFNSSRQPFPNGNSENPKMVADMFSTNDNKGQDSNDESSYYDDSKMSSNETALKENENFLLVKSSNGNKKAARKFLNFVKDEVNKLDKAFQKNLEKAKDEITKDTFYRRYNSVRQKLGLSEVDKSKIYTTNYAIPSQFNLMKVKMNEASAKLTRFFTVDVTTQSSKTSSFMITGLKDDVENCVSYLNDMNLSGDESLKLDSSQIGYIIGRGGKMIRQLENDYKVMVHISDQTITLYSTPDLTAKFKSNIQDILLKQRSPTFYEGFNISANIYQALVKHLSSEVRKISDETKTNINMIDKGSEGRISVKAKEKNDLESAIQKLKDLQNQITVYEVSKNPTTIEKFHSMPEYPSFMKNKNYFLTEERGKLTMTGLSHLIVNEKEKLDEIFKRLSTEPSKITLQIMQWNFCKKSSKYNPNKEVITLVSASLNDSCTIEFYGEASDIQNAKESLENFVNNEAFIGKFEISEAKFEVFGDYKRQIKQLEGSYGIVIEFPTSTKLWFTLMGNPERVEDAKNNIDKLLNQGSMLLRTVEIKPHQIPLLKGPEGATIKEIQSKSAIKYINIDDNNMVVKLKGTEESIKMAKLMIEKAISKGKDSNMVTENNGSYKNETKEMKSSKEAKESMTVKEGRTLKEKKEALEYSSTNETKSPLIKTNFQDNYEDTFPSLNESIKKL